MAKFEWDSFDEASSPKKSQDFSFDDFEEVPETKSPSESAARGFAQGASLGFADEISGGVEALWEKAKGDPAEFGLLYKKHRDESRANFDKASDDNPSAYLAGEVGGSLATAAVPMGGAATIGKAMLSGARVGALSALGGSRGETGKELLRDTVAGAGLGVVGGAAGKGMEQGIAIAKKLPAAISNRATNEAIETTGAVLSKESGSMPINNPSILNETTQSAKSRLKSYWSPDVDSKFHEFVEIAKKNGIDPSTLPESIKFGPDSSASRASRAIAEGRFGEETLKRFHRGIEQVQNAFNRKIEKYSGGLPVDEVTAGKVLRDSYDEGVSRFFDKMDITHNTIMDMAPGLQMTPSAMEKINSSLAGIEKFAKGRLIRGVTDTQRGQAKQLLSAAEAIRSSNGSYKQTVEALRDIGEAAFQSKNSLADTPVDVQKMRKIYNDLNLGLIDTVKSTLGKDIASSLVANNKSMSEFFSDNSLVSRLMGDKAIAPEKAFRSLILNGDSERINVLKRILPPEKWNYFKGAVLENIIKRDPEGGFAFKQLHNTLRNKSSALEAIFEPTEFIENADLVRLGDRFGSPVLSSSGTGASIGFADTWKSAVRTSIDSLAIKNANRAADKTLNPVLKPERIVRDVSPQIRGIPSKVAAVTLADGSSQVQNQKRGTEKWIENGAQKILEQYAVSPDAIERLKNSKSGRSLLIRASDLQPGSKAMEKLVNEIKSQEMSQ